MNKAIDTSIQQLLCSTKDTISALCEQYQVERLYLFGSVTTGRFTPESDLDMIVHFQELDWPPEDRGQLYWDLLDVLERLFDRKVDLLTDRAFDNPYFRQEVEKTKTLIYDRSQSTEILV